MTHPEDFRKIYVAASRAQRLLAIAVPKNQADRLAFHLGSGGIQITLLDMCAKLQAVNQHAF